jgi:hypothetical protein
LSKALGICTAVATVDLVQAVQPTWLPEEVGGLTRFVLDGSPDLLLRDGEPANVECLGASRGCPPIDETRLPPPDVLEAPTTGAWTVSQEFGYSERLRS